MAGKKKIPCLDFLADMSNYLDDDLPEELRAALEAHLETCSDCWVLYDETLKTVEVIQNIDCHPMPDAVRDRLMNTLEQQWRKS